MKCPRAQAALGIRPGFFQARFFLNDERAAGIERVRRYPVLGRTRLGEVLPLRPAARS
jgi:hypothetical protein